MPLNGDYLPSTAEWARTQAETYEATNGAEANTLRGVPVIVLTTVGAKTGGLRKTALMRVEQEGRYAVVASKGGAPEPPQWYFNLRKNPHVELQDGRQARVHRARAGRRRVRRVVGARGRRVARLRELPEEDGPQDRGVRAGAAGLISPAERRPGHPSRPT